MEKMSDPVVRLEGLQKRFGRREALRGLSLVIPAGITYGLIGPNGSGKTTLIRILAGISRPSSGEAFVLGRRMPDRSVAGSLGYMTQAEALYQDLTVEENLQFFGRVYGITGMRLKRRIDELLELVELKDRRRSLVEEISGGMKRRASLACTLVHEPKLLYLGRAHRRGGPGTAHPVLGLFPAACRFRGFHPGFHASSGRGVPLRPPGTLARGRGA